MSVLFYLFMFFVGETCFLHLESEGIMRIPCSFIACSRIPLVLFHVLSCYISLIWPEASQHWDFFCLAFLFPRSCSCFSGLLFSLSFFSFLGSNCWLLLNTEVKAAITPHLLILVSLSFSLLRVIEIKPRQNLVIFFGYHHHTYHSRCIYQFWSPSLPLSHSILTWPYFYSKSALAHLFSNLIWFLLLLHVSLSHRPTFLLILFYSSSSSLKLRNDISDFAIHILSSNISQQSWYMLAGSKEETLRISNFK